MIFILAILTLLRTLRVRRRAVAAAVGHIVDEETVR